MSNSEKSETERESSASEHESEAESNREKINKAPPLSITEKQILLELIDQRKHIIEDKSTNNVANINKKKEWDNIATEFCSQNGIVKRSAAQLKTWWENSKKRARRAISKKKRATKGTGGVKAKKSKPQSGAVEEAVMVNDVMKSLENPYDSNCGNTDTYFTGEQVVIENVQGRYRSNDDMSILNTSDLEIQEFTTNETPSSSGKKRKYNPQSALIDMELEEHKIRMKILTVKLETELIKKATAEEMKVYAYREHKKKMLTLDEC